MKLWEKSMSKKDTQLYANLTLLQCMKDTLSVMTKIKEIKCQLWFIQPHKKKIHYPPWQYRRPVLGLVITGTLQSKKFIYDKKT